MGCAKLIASSGIHRLVHYVDKSYESWNSVYNLLSNAGLVVIGVDK
jgi:hypothetical protein